MRLKEIKPGMGIHCNSDDEKKALLEEAERLGYIWINGCIPTDCIMVKSSGLTIHFHEKNEYYAFDHITWSNKASGVTEFTDLILHELTAEEVLQICAEICNESECLVCPFGEEHCFNDKDTDKSGIVAICEKWKSDHEKKEPEIEWFWKSYVVGGSDYKEADTEQEAMEWCEYYAKEHPEAKCTYKHVCRVKAVE